MMFYCKGRYRKRSERGRGVGSCPLHAPEAGGLTIGGMLLQGVGRGPEYCVLVIKTVFVVNEVDGLRIVGTENAIVGVEVTVVKP